MASGAMPYSPAVTASCLAGCCTSEPRALSNLGEETSSPGTWSQSLACLNHKSNMLLLLVARTKTRNDFL